MTQFDRRQFVAAAAALGAALAHGGVRAQAAARSWHERRDLFPQGVASGDPTADSVILWTRRPPGPEPAQRLDVEVAADPGFRRIVARGTSRIGADTDWTCRFLAAGLEPAREYWYRFTDEQGRGSRIGRTLTAPGERQVLPVRFAFVSCQDPTQGGMNAWRRMIHEDENRAADERLDFVLHLGDFIYEIVWYPEDRPQGMRGRRLRDLFRYPSGEKMQDFHLPTTLEDYRTVYRAYLQDPDLQDARARWPFVCVWDNHEFSWQGWQSQQVFGGESRPAQSKKVAANRAWWEYQPGRFRHAGGNALDRFVAPEVADAPVTRFDAHGLGTEPNNLAAVRSLVIYRTLKWGRNLDLILTDNHSFRAPPPDDGGAFNAEGFRWMVPQEAADIIDRGTAANGGRPPATIRFGGQELPNPGRDKPPQSHLGQAQKAWFLDQLRGSQATWKVWGHSFGTLVWRTDAANLPEGLGPAWPGAGYALLNGAFFAERAEICDLVRREGITGFAIVAGDKHSFWAGLVSADLPPAAFDPVGVEFITGAISSQNLFEVAEQTFPRADPLRPLYLHDRPDGSVAPAMNMTVLHGVRASLELQRSGDPVAARALRNPDVAPHLAFADMGGHGYAVVHATADALETEFVAIPRPYERSDRPDGGPIAYRVVHRVPRWAPGERPRLEQVIVEGDPPLAAHGGAAS